MTQPPYEQQMILLTETPRIPFFIGATFHQQISWQKSATAIYATVCMPLRLRASVLGRTSPTSIYLMENRRCLLAYESMIENTNFGF